MLRWLLKSTNKNICRWVPECCSRFHLRAKQAFASLNLLPVTSYRRKQRLASCRSGELPNSLKRQNNFLTLWKSFYRKIGKKKALRFSIVHPLSLAAAVYLSKYEPWNMATSNQNGRLPVLFRKCVLPTFLVRPVKRHIFPHSIYKTNVSGCNISTEWTFDIAHVFHIYFFEHRSYLYSNSSCRRFEMAPIDNKLLIYALCRLPPRY